MRALFARQHNSYPSSVPTLQFYVEDAKRGGSQNFFFPLKPMRRKGEATFESKLVDEKWQSAVAEEHHGFFNGDVYAYKPSKGDNNTTV